MHVQGNPSLFSGYGVEPLEEIPWPEYNMTKINIVKGTNPITDPLPDYEWVLYYGGPEFHPYGEENNIIAIGTYALNGQPAMVAFQCGAGRVFLSGPHPEIEENSTRDGVSWGEAMDDRGSD